MRDYAWEILKHWNQYVHVFDFSAKYIISGYLREHLNKWISKQARV